MKRFVLLPALLYGMLFPLFAQQLITKVAVVDVGRIILSLAGTLEEAKTYTEKRDRIQAEIEKRNKELQELNTKLNEAVKQENKNQIRDLERQIDAKKQSVQLYITTNFAELEKDLEKVTKNSSFMTQLNNALRFVAESDGYSIVLSKQEASGILWYSLSVDITNKVIERLRSSKR
jgi:outer membrane protein